MSLHSSVSQLQSLTTLRSGSGASGSSATTPRGNAETGSQQQVLERLAAHIPGMDADAVGKLDAKDFTPEKVANRIADAVATGLESARARGRSEAEVEQLYQQAVEGARKGFEEAREILSNLDMLQGKVAEQLDETEQLTFAALDSLAPSNASKPTDFVAVVGANERFQYAESLSLEINTRDGDTVRIDFNHQFDHSQSAMVASDGETDQIKYFNISRTSSETNYGFSVKGDLDAEELDAIRNLVQDTSELANTFFQGDVQAAFAQAGSLSFDSSQLSHMDLNMRSSASYSVTQVQRYQETQQLGDMGRGQDISRKLDDMLSQMRETFSQPLLNNVIEDVPSAGADLMRGLVEQDSRFITAEPRQQDDYRAQMTQLLDTIAPGRARADD
ncbi:hypothetical protein MARPU_13660 [Marichromatium purpuratum 984]|uniref:DUF5610 domain-containing protein n=1 Tax=Marichromatium purpuratum 984 TaxID=765910 RepID=W0E1P6_MARPU|nr:hypothetical protein MARPU_13660 [Marichromatium purpuratum 984]